MFCRRSTQYIIIYMIGTCTHIHTPSADDGIKIALRGRVIPNHGLVTIQEIGVDSNGTNFTVGLSCSTTYDSCCSDYTGAQLTARARNGHSPSGVGSWLYPQLKRNNKYITRQVDQPLYIFGIRRISNENAVYLFRNNHNHVPSRVIGIWQCVILDSNGREQSKYIGIYNETNSKNGEKLCT